MEINNIAFFEYDTPSAPIFSVQTLAGMTISFADTGSCADTGFTASRKTLLFTQHEKLN